MKIEPTKPVAPVAFRVVCLFAGTLSSCYFSVGSNDGLTKPDNQPMTRRCLIIGLISALLVGGCSVVFNPQFPPGPEVTLKGGAKAIGLAPVLEGRTDTMLGKIGLAQIVAGPELTNYLYQSLSAALAQNGFAPQNAPDPGKASTVGFSAKIVQATLQSATLGTFDAIMAPAQISLSVAIRAYDPAGKVLYSQTYQGESKGYIGMHSQAGYETRTGEVLSQAVNQVVGIAMSDQQLLKVLN